MKHCLIKSKLYIFHLAILLIFTHRHIRKLCIKTFYSSMWKDMKCMCPPPPRKMLYSIYQQKLIFHTSTDINFPMCSTLVQSRQFIIHLKYFY